MTTGEIILMTFMACYNPKQKPAIIKTCVTSLTKCLDTAHFLEKHGKEVIEYCKKDSRY